MSDWKEQRAALLGKANALLTERPFTKEMKSQFDSYMSMAEAITPVQDSYRRHQLNSVLGEMGLPKDLRGATLEEERDELRKVLRGEIRTYNPMNSGTGSNGGYFIPQGYERLLVSLMAANGPLYAGSPWLTNLPTSTGAPTVLPMIDDTGSTGYIQNQAGSVTEAEAALGQVSESCTTFSSGIVVASTELEQDAFVSVEQVLMRNLAQRLSRIQNKTWLTALLTALGSNGSASVPAAGASIAADDVLSVIYSVNAAYRASAKCGFVMNTSTAKAIAALKDSGTGRYTFRFKRDPQTQQVTLKGYPVLFSDYADSIASGKNPIVFGDLSYVIVRHLPTIELQVLKTRFADQGSVGVVARQRGDMQFACPTSSDAPVKYLHFA